MVFCESNIKKKTVYINIESEHREIIFYSLLAFVESDIVPIFHTFVDPDYARKIPYFKNFFSQWLKEKLVPPRELVVPPNYNIIEGAISCFNHQTASEYNNYCFGLVFGGKLVPSKPSCVIKFDISSLLVNFYQRNMGSDNRQNFILKFYTCCFFT